ncbi:MAG: hypothetical protein IKH93_00785 [Bacteroidales bacterium]|nr:hypothetical protein [Bacteroidales bacterium]
MEITKILSQTAIDYKKNIAGKYMLVEGSKLSSRVAGTDFFVTRKIDGHLQILFYKDGDAVLLNSRGIDKAGKLHCLEVAAECLKKAGVKDVIVAAELYMPREGGRPRCADVTSALADDTRRDQLCLAPFDIVSLDGKSFEGVPYQETYKALSDIFKADSVCPVQMMHASSLDEVQAIYDEWVECDGAEGLVIHSDSSIVAKVKPRHSIDAAIVGYTTGELGVRDLMLAVRREDGLFQVFAVGSGALSDVDRTSLAGRLQGMNVESRYVLTDSRGIAYQMVRPEIVWEVSVIELVARGNDDKVRMNALVSFDGGQWLHEGMTPGVSAFGLSFIRERTDKTPSETDIRVSQLTDLCPFEEVQGLKGELTPSTILDRRVYRKISGDKVMLHKFLIWKTNKEATSRYPAYIFYHTDYSSGRKDILKRDMAYAPDEAGIRSIFKEEILSNIKKGWEAVA